MWEEKSEYFVDDEIKFISCAIANNFDFLYVDLRVWPSVHQEVCSQAIIYFVIAVAQHV